MPLPSYFSWNVSPIVSNKSWNPNIHYIDPIEVTIQQSGIFILSNYDDFRISVTVYYSGTAEDWISLYGSNFQNGIISPAISKNIKNYISLVNLSTLPNEIQSATVHYTLQGLSDGIWQDIENRYVDIYLTVSGNGNSIKTDKTSYNVYYNKTTGDLLGNTKILILNNTENIDLYLESDGNTFTADTEPFISSFDLKLNSTSLLPYFGEKTITCFLRKIVSVSYTRIYSFQVKLVIIESSVSVTQESLSFSLIKSLSEQKSSKISIFNPEEKVITITAPSWLTISKSSVSNSEDISVTTVNSSSIDVGTYSGEIVFSFDNETIVVPVLLKVITFVSHNINEDYNFCLDNKELQLRKMVKSAIFVKITAQYRFRNALETQQKEVIYTIPYFNDFAKINIGEITHKYFLKSRTNILAEPCISGAFENKIVFYPCEINLFVEELNISQSSVYSENLGTLKLYPGKKPKCFPFMTNFPHRSRIPGGKHIFSYLGDFVSWMNICDTYVTQNTFKAGIIERVKIEESEIKVNWTSVKTFNVAESAITFYELPKQRNLVCVQWENQNLCPESFSFSGELSFKEEKTHIAQESIFTGKREKMDTTTNRTLVINTGFIIKEEENLINEMMDSRFCIIEYGDKYYKTYPITSNITIKDSMKELISFDLEFQLIDRDGN